MAQGDLTYYRARLADKGAIVYNVAAGTPIYAGEPVQVDLAGTVVYPAITNTPVVGTSYYAGIAATNSTNTASVAGTVDVNPISAADVLLGNPDVAASWDTQTEYDALVGHRVLIKNSVSVTGTPTSGTYTILASDSADNGCVVVPLNVFKVPGKVAFCIRNGANYLA